MDNDLSTVLLITSCIAASVSTPRLHAQETERSLELLEVQTIWDRAPHNAFTDLHRFDNKWYCAFREGSGHVSGDGRLRVIRSQDGREWASVSLMEWEGGDVRDAKLSLSAEGQLMLNGAVRFLKPVEDNTHQSVTWLEGLPENWTVV